MKQNHFFAKNRKGVAIELAIGYTVVIFALCAILTTVSVSTRLRDRRISNQSNEYFLLDQAGEYFVKSVEKMGAGEDALSQDYKTQTEKPYKDMMEQYEKDSAAGKDLKNIVDLSTDYKFDFLQSTINQYTNRFTMKVFNKQEYDETENKSLLTPMLIVSVERHVDGRNVDYKIINWSNQENQQERYYDAKTPIDKNSKNWGWLIGLFLLIIVVVTVCVICLI